MRYFKLLFLLLILSVPLWTNAQNEDPNKKIPLERNDSSSKGDRPRMPAKYSSNVECYYLDGWIHLVFDEPEGNAVLIVTDMADGSYVRQQFNTTIPTTLYIGEVDSTFKIEIVTAEGHHYIGWLL